jgi:hypothetical protein
MHPKNVETIDEMIEKNFTFHTLSNSFYLFEEMEFTKR